MICCGWLAKGAGPTKSPAPPLLPQTPDWEKWLNPGPEAVRCLGGAFAGAVAPGAGAGGADGADLEPVLRAAGQAGDGAARGFADVALRPGSAGREGLLGDVGLDAAPEGVNVGQCVSPAQRIAGRNTGRRDALPYVEVHGQVHGAFEVAAGGVEVGGLGELADGRAGGLQFPAAALESGAVGGERFGTDRQGPRGSLGGDALVVARGEHLTGGLLSAAR